MTADKEAKKSLFIYKITKPVVIKKKIEKKVSNEMYFSANIYYNNLFTI